MCFTCCPGYVPPSGAREGYQSAMLAPLGLTTLELSGMQILGTGEQLEQSAVNLKSAGTDKLETEDKVKGFRGKLS